MTASGFYMPAYVNTHTHNTHIGMHTHVHAFAYTHTFKYLHATYIYTYSHRNMFTKNVLGYKDTYLLFKKKPVFQIRYVMDINTLF